MAFAPKLPGHGLTEKETKFVAVIAKQIQRGEKINLTHAALQSYNVNGPSSASMVGSETFEKPRVKEAIEEVLQRNGLTLDAISRNVGKIATKEPAKVDAATILKANIELLKLYRVYPGQRSAHVSVSIRANLTNLKFQEVKDELKKIDSELSNVMEGDIVKE